MGPGFHSQIEKKFFESASPSINFWNQPPVTSFTDLQSSTEKVFLNLNSDKVELLAHSFGAQLAMGLSTRFPDKITKITMLNAGVDPFECFINLGIALKVIELKDTDHCRQLETMKKVEFIIQVASTPGFAETYWHSPLKMKSMESHFAAERPLDTQIFVAIFIDYLNQQRAFYKSIRPWNGTVSIFSSDDDALLTFKKDVEPWKSYFPKAQFIRIKNVGHYAHLEDPAVAKLFLSL